MARRLPVVVLLWPAISCGDPVRDRAIAALGPEAAGVAPGPLHRPGQPCLLCHDQAAGLAPVYSVAGTVYARAETDRPVRDVTVRLIDADGRRFDATSNCAGNFYVRPPEYTPRYPLWVTLAAESQVNDMESPVYRDGSCAACHTDPKGPASAGHVYFLVDAADLPESYYCR